MLISVVIPAFNEEAFLGEVLASLRRASAFVRDPRNVSVEIIVVDNNSSDATAFVAREFGAAVVAEPRHNVATVRNTGARSARGDVLVFVDADTVVPDLLLCRIAEEMFEPKCLGGALDTDYRPEKFSSKIYLRLWSIIGKLAGVAQGATQFARREVFWTLEGYDETLFMGEDVDFHWRLKKFARRASRSVSFIKDIKVVPSTRRFDQWGLGRILIWTNPLFILLFRRKETAWRGWYRQVPR